MTETNTRRSLCCSIEVYEWYQSPHYFIISCNGRESSALMRHVRTCLPGSSWLRPIKWITTVTNVRPASLRELLYPQTPGSLPCKCPASNQFWLKVALHGNCHFSNTVITHRTRSRFYGINISQCRFAFDVWEMNTFLRTFWCQQKTDNRLLFNLKK